MILSLGLRASQDILDLCISIGLKSKASSNICFLNLLNLVINGLYFGFHLFLSHYISPFFLGKGHGFNLKIMV